MDIKALLRSNRQRRFRRQLGTVVTRADGYYLRFYTDDATGRRVKITERIADLDTKPHTLKNLQRKRMKEVNNNEVHRSETRPEAVTIGTFWEADYLPYAERALRSSTVIGYKKTWSLYLSSELTGKRFTDYQTENATAFLTRLVEEKDLNRTSVHHVKWLGSAIYRHARTIGRYKGENPWVDARSLVPAREPNGRTAYELEEVFTVLEALPRIDQKLFVAIGAFLGLRPSEIAGLRFEDIDGEQVNVRRSAPYGIPGPLKTKKSSRKLLIIEPVKSLLAAWHEQNGKVTEGWIFQRRDGTPVNSSDFMREPSIEAKKVCARWVGVGACRNTNATLIHDLTGNLMASCQVLGNTVETQYRHYQKPSMEAGHAGQRLLEAAGTKFKGGK